MKRERVVAVSRDDPERAVAGADESARGLDDSREETVEVRVGLNEEDCIDQSMESLRIVDFVKRHYLNCPTLRKWLNLRGGCVGR